jgi:hypothetical protein
MMLDAISTLCWMESTGQGIVMGTRDPHELRTLAEIVL